MTPVWLLCGLLAAPAAPPRPHTRADPPASARAPADAPRRVALGLAGLPPSFTDATLQRVLAGYLADLDPPRTASVERLPAGDAVLPQIAWARARSRDPDVERVLWLELRSPGPHRLHLLDPRADRVYLRELDDADPDLLLESLGVVVRALVSSLSEGTPPGMQALDLPAPAPAPALPEPPAKDPTPTPAPPTRLHLDLALGYRASSFNAAIPAQHGVAAHFLIIARRGLLLGLGGGYLSPGTSSTQAGLALAIDRVPLALRLGYRLRRDRPLHLDLDLGLVAEVVRARVVGEPPTSPRTTTTARVGLAPGLGLGWHPLLRRFGVPLGLHLHLQLDVWLRDLALAVRGPGGDLVLADAAPVGATLDLALRYTFGAASRPRRTAAAAPLHNFSSVRAARVHQDRRACSPSPPP